MEAIVLAGGLGTRLSQVIKSIPKPMAPIAGRPFLSYLLDYLVEQNITKVIIAVCHKKEFIMSFFGSFYRGIEISYSIEEAPLFTGGAVKQALTLCNDERVFVLNGDSYFPINLNKMRTIANQTNKPLVVAVKHMKKFERYGTVNFEKDRIIEAFIEKKPCKEGWINAGIYDIKRDSLTDYPLCFSLEEDFFPNLVSKKEIVAYPDEKVFIDIGVPDDYKRAEQILRHLI